jgi:hypothetical protein
MPYSFSHLYHKHLFLRIVKYELGCCILHSEHSLRSGSAVAPYFLFWTKPLSQRSHHVLFEWAVRTTMMGTLSVYEQERQARIERNQRILEAIGAPGCLAS